MKLIHLAYKNIGGQSKSIDFTSKIAGCITVSEVAGQSLANALGLALYGAQDDFGGIAFPAQATLKFAIDDAQYTIVRNFVLEGGGPKEEAELLDISETETIAQGTEEVNKFLADKFLVGKSAFDKLFIADREATAESLTKDAASRAQFISGIINAITSPAEILAKVEILKDSERKLNGHIDGIPPVTRKGVKEQQTLVAADKVEVDTIRNDIAAVHAAIARARQYEEDLGRLNLEAGNLEKLKEKKAAVDSNALFLARAREVAAIRDIYTRYDGEREIAEQVKREYDAKKAERDALEAKIKEGEQSSKALEQKFIYHSEKTVEIDKQLRELLQQTAKNPDALKINEIIEHYYSANAKQIQDLEAKKKSLDTEYQALKDACIELETRRGELKNTAEYKKTVEDGAVMEASIARINKEISELEASIAKHEKEQISLYEQNIAQTERIREFQAKYKELDAAIRKDKASHKEAVDAVILYAQSIYAKHIIAAAHEAEIKAVDKKIAKLKATNDTFRQKKEAIALRKKEVELHIEKLEIKQKALNDKLAEYRGFNRLKDYSDSIEYGSRCPICDSFVTVKKDIPVKDTGLLEEQLGIVTAEIEKDRQSIAEAANFILQYDSNLSISEQYLAALEETKKQKQDAINAILAEFGAATLADLYAKTLAAAEESTKIIRNLSDFHQVDAELRRLQENNNNIVSAYNRLSQELLPAEKERFAALHKELVEIVAKYETIQPVLNGENAEDLLVKLQIVERELERTESELEEKQIKLAEIAEQRQDTVDKLAAIQNRITPLQIKNNRYTYKQVVVKSIAETLNKLLDEREQNEEQKEIAKTRLAGVRRVIEKYKARLIELDKELAGLWAKVEAFNLASEGVYKPYKERFAVLGINSKADLDSLTFSPDELARREKEVEEYREALAKAQSTVDEIIARLNANESYYNEREQNMAALEELEGILQKAVVKYNNSLTTLEEMASAYNELIESNRKLSALQEKLRAAEEILSAVTESGVDAGAFAGIVIDRAAKKVERWTSDKYTLQTGADGRVSLYNNLKGKIVSPSKYNKEERMLVNAGLSLAFSGAIADIMAFDLPLAASVSADETEKTGLKVLLEAAKDKELILIPENADLLYKTISKIA
ncbi:MAG TPA: hypothetical protein PLS05_05775 [Clostridia bacterium]|nr:hypothetical protein [Clostridia bacterium]